MPVVGKPGYLFGDRLLPRCLSPTRERLGVGKKTLCVVPKPDYSET